MKKTKLQTKTPIDSWLLGQATALITYASGDDKFAESLAHHVQQRHWATISVQYTQPGSVYLLPNKQADAVSTAGWLLQTLDTTNSANVTKRTLAIWAEDYQEPKDLIIGIVGLAIIGPTLGILNKKKKSKSQLQIVVGDEWEKPHTAKDLTTLAIELSQQVIAKELVLAGGNVYQLHPDTAAWCMEEPLTKVHLADQKELREIKTVAENEGLSFSLREENEKIIAMAISPTVNDNFIDEFEVVDLE